MMKAIHSPPQLPSNRKKNGVNGRVEESEISLREGDEYNERNGNGLNGSLRVASA